MQSNKRQLLMSGLNALEGGFYSEFASTILPVKLTSIEDLVVESLRSKMFPVLFADPTYKEQLMTLGLDCLDSVMERAQNLVTESSKAVLSKVHDRGVQVAAIKGLDFSNSLYKEGVTRTMEDGDFLILPTDIPTVENEMYEMGYQQGNVDQTTMKISKLSQEARDKLYREHYELPSFFTFSELELTDQEMTAVRKYLKPITIVPIGSKCIYITFLDFHYNLSISLDLDDIWDGASPRETSDLDSRTLYLAPEVVIWFLSGRIYTECFIHQKCTLRYFVDLCGLVSQEYGTLNWDTVIYLNEKYDSFCGAYYVLRNLHELSDGKLVPREVIESLRTQVFNSDQARNFGDMMPRILGEDMYHGAFRKADGHGTK